MHFGDSAFFFQRQYDLHASLWCFMSGEQVILRVCLPHDSSFLSCIDGGRRSPAVACWASDHWVASSNPLRGKFRH